MTMKEILICWDRLIHFLSTTISRTVKPANIMASQVQAAQQIRTAIMEVQVVVEVQEVVGDQTLLRVIP